MTIFQAVNAGLAGEKLSRTITGTSEVSAGRSAVATGTGALMGGVAASTLTGAASAIGFTALVTATAPVTVTLTVASGAVALIRSLWD